MGARDNGLQATVERLQGVLEKSMLAGIVPWLQIEARAESDQAGDGADGIVPKLHVEA